MFSKAVKNPERSPNSVTGKISAFNEVLKIVRFNIVARYFEKEVSKCDREAEIPILIHKAGLLFESEQEYRVRTMLGHMWMKVRSRFVDAFNSIIPPAERI